MKILIASPLYPPDIAPSASYVKELAKRFPKDHLVTILTYGNLPERVEGVTIATTSKKRPLFIRLLTFTILLVRYMKDVDAIHCENGASVELPVVIVATLFKKPLLFHIGDEKAFQSAKTNKAHAFIHSLIKKKAVAVIDHRTPPKPEILPFGDSVAEKVTVYEKEWERHIAELLFNLEKHV